MVDKNEFIHLLVQEGALRFGTFTLKSGIKSPFFINLGDICSGRALQGIGQALAQTMHDYFKSVTIAYGPPYKGISLITATAISWLNMFQKDIHTLYSRKEAKGHGEQGRFVGRFPRSTDHIVVIDDVLSTGGTKVEAIRQLEETFDCKVEGVLVTVDRRSKGTENNLGNYPLRAIITLTDIIEYLQAEQNPHAQEMRAFYEGNYE